MTLDSVVRRLVALEGRVARLESAGSDGDGLQHVSHGLEVALLKLGAAVASSEAAKAAAAKRTAA